MNEWIKQYNAFFMNEWIQQYNAFIMNEWMNEWMNYNAFFMY